MANFALPFVWHVDFVHVPAAYPDELVVWGLDTEEGDDPFDLTAILINWWTNDLDGNVKRNVALERIVVSGWNATTGRFQAIAQDIPAVPIAGSGGTFLPPQCSVVVSQRTTEIPGSLGSARKRNRSFLGYVGASIFDASAQILAANRVLIVNSFMTLDTALQALPRVAPVGRGGLAVTSVAAGLAADTTQILVGSVVDTQRRRRNKIIETYSSGFPV